MKCEYCDNPIPNGVQRCPSCGAAVCLQQSIESAKPTVEIETPISRTTTSNDNVKVVVEPKSRMVYVLLGIFLGSFGVHNFYAGRSNRAVGQLLTTLLAGWLVIPIFAVWIWCVVDICAITTDGDGIKFR